MRILDDKRDSSIDRATLLLTRSEAQELLDSLQALLADGKGQHAHVPSEDHQKEIAVAIYEPGHTEGFNQRCQKLIQENA
jgi:hypothetical protein